MNKEKILIVDDEPIFALDYRRWLGNDYIIDDAENAEQAIEKLKAKYYAVVLLDLSLHITHPGDRSSEEVQKYLMGHPEGTKHIIISGQAQRDDVRTAAIKYKAADVIYKTELEDIDLFREKVNNAVAASQIERPFFYEEAYDIFCKKMNFEKFEYDVLKLLKPDGPSGAVSGWNRFKDDLFRSIAPIYNHMTMGHAVFEGNCILGVFWSRGLGHAVSVCLANKNVKEEECIQTLNSWLGREHGNPIKYQGSNIIGYVFKEADLAIDDFKFINIEM